MREPNKNAMVHFKYKGISRNSSVHFKYEGTKGSLRATKGQPKGNLRAT